jgi:hypothetical protein
MRDSQNGGLEACHLVKEPIRGGIVGTTNPEKGTMVQAVNSIGGTHEAKSDQDATSRKDLKSRNRVGQQKGQKDQDPRRKEG